MNGPRKFSIRCKIQRENLASFQIKKKKQNKKQKLLTKEEK